MIGAFVIVLREVIEAGLIIGIVLAATRGVAGRGRWVAFGVGGGLAGALVVALFAERISEMFQGAGQELLNAGVLCIAVVMLIWHNAWMARHGRELIAQMNSVGAAISSGERPLAALAVVVGVAVLREGFEVVLFLYGLLASGTAPTAVAGGGGLGLAAGASLALLTYFGLLAVPSSKIFGVTGVLIALLAAGMAAQAAHYLYQAGMYSGFGAPLWDTSAWLAEDGVAGRALHTLVGYTERPTGMQVAVYAATLLAMVVAARLASNTPRRVIA